MENERGIYEDEELIVAKKLRTKSEVKKMRNIKVNRIQKIKKT
jgi:hypothetical protein